MKQYTLTISRLITGAVFVFSGFVKGVDPLGTAYKLEDYFAAYGMLWANDLSLFLSILLCTIEFSIGMALLLKFKPRLTAWALLLMMIFFTLLTFYDALYAPVPDCGCFGDAIKLTNWQTFYKNIVLLVFTVVVFRHRQTKKNSFSVLSWTPILLIFGIFASFSWFNYRHLPMIDFRPWKVGNQMNGDPSAETKVFLSYRHKVTGELKEYQSPDYPWNDSSWIANWEFVDQRFETDKPLIAHNLVAEDSMGNDLTYNILESPVVFVLVAYDLNSTTNKGKQKMVRLVDDIQKLEANHYVITASLPDEADSFLQKLSIQSDLLFADEVVLKTMIRSNPGLVLFNKGKVIAKWHYNDFPNALELKELIEELRDTK